VDGIRTDENEMFNIRPDAVLQIRPEVMEGIRLEVKEEIEQATRCDVDVNRAIFNESKLEAIRTERVKSLGCFEGFNEDVHNGQSIALYEQEFRVTIEAKRMGMDDTIRER